MDGFCVIRGLLDGFDDPGPTPGHWSEADRDTPLDIALMLVAASLGRVFGWTGQQDGRIVHNILPAKGYEHLQVGASSTTPLYWHTEDAFHPHRADLLLLACVRNHENLGSRVSSIRRATLTDAQIATLSQPGLTILPDDSYPSRPRGEVHPMATLWPASDGLCVRYDPSYTRMLTDDPDFEAAYAALDPALEKCAVTVPMRAGDIALIDNDVAVHGRAAFEPRFDGTDRWLKRILIHLDRPRPPAELTEDGYGEALIETEAGRTA
ncbi:TauD/TfdA family dioxygenase [Nonomuraea sp. NPDC050556]|uniref:TauD/TfdA family dioxygenase n=1 Tax=Nonomuraea sp. NPDC050556 TaxID=3364369 RepID=UPI0037AC0D77